MKWLTNDALSINEDTSFSLHKNPFDHVKSCLLQHVLVLTQIIVTTSMLPCTSRLINCVFIKILLCDCEAIRIPVV